MTEKEKKKKNEENLRRLNSGRDEVIIETLTDLRNKGSDEVLPAVFTVLAESRSQKVADQLSEFLNDLNNKVNPDIIITSLKTHESGMNYDKMISSCWQNGIDFSKHLDFFVDIAVKKDYNTAIEAFSVIEENLSLLSIAERENLADYLNTHLPAKDQSKNKLLQELKNVISSFSGPLGLDLG